MDFNLTEEQKLILDLAEKIAHNFPPSYWYEKEEKKEFADEFYRAISDAGFLGIVIPKEYGGSGLGMVELSLCVERLCESGLGMAGAWYICLSEIFGAIPILRHGDKKQKEKYLPKIATGQLQCCMALTEPEAGTNTFSIKTFAKEEEDFYRVSGQKIFISGVDQAGCMVLIARTKKASECERKDYGITIFLVDLPNPSISFSKIEKHGISYSNTCEVFIDDLMLPKSSVLGEKDKGWQILLDILNPERMIFSAAAIGIGKLAIKEAVKYSKKRVVFSDPIGSYQAIQHPLAKAFSELEAANLLLQKACWSFDQKKSQKEIGDLSNMAKAVSVINAEKAVYFSMQTFGGYGYAKEYHIERWWREVNLLRLAPITEQMVLNYIAEHILGMPKSYRV